MSSKRPISEYDITPAKKIRATHGIISIFFYSFFCLLACDFIIFILLFSWFINEIVFTLFGVTCFADTVFESPSFDLGIDNSPAGLSDVTPRNKVFAIQPLLSSVQQASRTPDSEQPTCGLPEASLVDASRHLAQCIILDIVHVTEEDIDPTGKVLYGQFINQPVQKLVVSDDIEPCISWSSELIHTKHDPDAVRALVDCCNELSETTVRR